VWGADSRREGGGGKEGRGGGGDGDGGNRVTEKQVCALGGETWEVGRRGGGRGAGASKVCRVLLSRLRGGVEKQEVGRERLPLRWGEERKGWSRGRWAGW